MKNAIVFVHGMTPRLKSADITQDWVEFWNILQDKNAELKRLRNEFIPVFTTWGHDNGKANMRPDECISLVQEKVSELVTMEAVREDKSEDNLLFTAPVRPIGRHAEHNRLPVGGPFSDQNTLVDAGLRKAKEDFFLRGFSDVVYYCSREGEQEVRKVLMKQIHDILGSIDEEITLHFICHSVGVTITFDILRGLFHKPAAQTPPSKDPADLASQELQASLDIPEWFIHGQANRDACGYAKLREKAEKKSLKLGSISAMASQLPIFVMKMPYFMNPWLEGKGLFDRTHFGLRSGSQTGPVQCKFFYDQGDPLGFPSRKLFQDPVKIQDIEVRVGDVGSHSGYFLDTRENGVIRHIGKTLLENMLDNKV